MEVNYPQISKLKSTTQHSKNSCPPPRFAITLLCTPSGHHFDTTKYLKKLSANKFLYVVQRKTSSIQAFLTKMFHLTMDLKPVKAEKIF